MRLILMGTGPFAVPSFEALRRAGHEIVFVVTRPIAMSSGKKQPPPSPVRMWAGEHSLRISDPPSINTSESVEWLSSLRADLMVVCDYGQILSRDALAATKLGGINLHGSLLPRHRGAAPVQWSILAGDDIAGVSIIHMTPALDGGPVLHRLSTPISPTENAAELEHRLSQIGIVSILESVAMLQDKQSIEACKELGVQQDKALATKAPRLSKEDGELNMHYPVKWLDRLIRGLQPWPGSFAHLKLPDNKTLRIIIPMAEPIECNIATASLVPGELLFGDRLKECWPLAPQLQGSVLCAVATDGVLAIPYVQPAGKRLMAADEFLRGHSRYQSMFLTGTQGEHRLLHGFQK